MTMLLNVILLNALIAAVMAVTVWFAGIIPAVRRRPGLKQVLWMLVLVKLVTPPLLEVSVLPAAVRAEPERRSSPAIVSTRPLTQWPAVPVASMVVETPRAEPPQETHTVNWLAVLAATGGLGTLTVLALAVKQVYGLRRKLSEVTRPEERLEAVARTCAAAMGLDVPPAVHAVPANVSPLLWVRRSGPEIVLPQRLVAQLTDEQLRCVVSHEIAHYLRKDHWTNLFSLLVAAFCWWNPVVWWARRELRTAREACCDALVISRSIAPRRIYAETLYQALDFIQTERAPLPALASGFGGKSSTQRRFEMIANPRVNHRLSWWCYAVLLAALTVLPCLPVRGDSKSSEADQQAEAGADQNVVPREPRLWKLQDPSGSDYYLQMNGFEGQFLELWFKGGSGVVFDTGNLQKIIDNGGIPATFGFATGGLGGDGFPDWIRAYRFDPEKKEFDGSWYTLSVTDKELGKAVVREVVNADLAAEIRRKASGIPVLLPRDAKVWRLVIQKDLQRPSMQRYAGGKTAEAEPKENTSQKPSQETKPSQMSDLNGMIDSQWMNGGYGIPRVQGGVLQFDLNQANGLPRFVPNQFNRLTLPHWNPAAFQWQGAQLHPAAPFFNSGNGWPGWQVTPIQASDDGVDLYERHLRQLLQLKSAAEPSVPEQETTWVVNSVRTEQTGSKLKMTIDCLAGSDMIEGSLDLWKRFYGDATVEQIRIMPRAEPKMLIVIKGHSSDGSPQGPGAEKATEKHDPPAERDEPGDADPPGEQD